MAMQDKRKNIVALLSDLCVFKNWQALGYNR